jgi:hypothetical protein
MEGKGGGVPVAAVVSVYHGACPACSEDRLGCSVYGVERGGDVGGGMLAASQAERGSLLISGFP